MMDNKTFKKIFDEIAKNHWFEAAFGGWFRESPECIVVLDLQKSDYGNYYYLNIKVFIQSVFGKHYQKSMELVKKYMGNIPVRPKQEYDLIFNLDASLADNERKEKIDSLFEDFVTPFTNNTLTLAGIRQLVQNKELSLLPSVQQELNERFQLDI